jgi:hypothetical protein
MRFFFFTLLLVACDTKNEAVCNDVGDCSHGGSTDWVEQCKANAAALDTESHNSGCGDLFDSYYECAKSKYTCSGNVASFPGCDRSALDTCLTKARAGTACANLSNTCGGDGGTCTVGQDCQARCYLDIVKNPCAPSADELDGVSVCSAACPQ